MRTIEFKLVAKEIPERYHGQTVVLQAPGSLEEIGARCAEDADPAKVVDGFLFKQGIDLTIQKRFKRVIGIVHAATPEAPIEEVIDEARKQVDAWRFPNPREKGTGTGAGGVKAARAERDAAKAEAQTLRDNTAAMYRALQGGARKQVREMLLNAGTFTAEELDALEAQA